MDDNESVDDDAATGEVQEVPVLEILPGVAFAIGDLSTDLQQQLSLRPVDAWLTSGADRRSIANFISAAGTAGTVARGNVAQAVASAQGFYQLAPASQAAIKAGARLAVKDGANLGALVGGPHGLAQARFIKVPPIGTASFAATVGPALAMMALQLMLNEVTDLLESTADQVRTVLADLRKQQDAAARGLADAVDRVLEQARRTGTVPPSLWETVAPSEARLREQRDLFRRHLDDHVRQVTRLDGRELREYLDTHGDRVVSDTFALLASLRAWTGYQALRAARARAAGEDDPDEARLFEVIMQDVPEEAHAALSGVRDLVGSLHGRLRVLVELDEGHAFTRRDARAVRERSQVLLDAIEPVVQAVCPPSVPLEAPAVLSAPTEHDVGVALRILRWLLEPDEEVRAIGVADAVDSSGSVQAAVRTTVQQVRDAIRLDSASQDLLVVTDRRILTARTDALAKRGRLDRSIPLDDVRYVRAATGQGSGSRAAIDLVTREENSRWLFDATTDPATVGHLAAVLAEHMTVPDEERTALVQGQLAQIADESETEGRPRPTSRGE